MTQGTDRGGAPAETVADVGTSGDGSGVDEGPFLSLVAQPDESTEYEQLSLTLFLDKVETAEQAADVFARLYKTQQSINWLMVDVVVHVDSGHGGRGVTGGVADFAKKLRDKHRIDISDRFLQELRRLGQHLQALPDKLRARARSLPVTTVVKALRSTDVEAALDYAESHSQKELEEYLRLEKVALADPLMPLELRPWNVWNFATRTPKQGESGYKWGAMCGQIIEHLLWYYTEPGDLVIDPMAGTGVTYDACKRMQREPRCFDKTPTRPEIDKRDVYDGLPEKIAQLVFLDPPYFDIMENEFQSYEAWKDFLEVCVSHAQYALKPGGYLALILKNKCILRDNPKYALIGDAYEILAAHEGLEFENMILTPLPNQLPGFKVNRAKEERTMLNLARLIWVFRRSI